MTIEEPKNPNDGQLPMPKRHRELTDRTFVYADGPLAEILCDAYLMELTVIRARQLRESHRMHRPDDCWVHLQAAARLAGTAED
ncbi:hypothetical protein [Nocardia aurea]|uniref:hypothetical protein n=1 Tax=Nocardia aurea TaxID=2144174 RepID=UPI001E3587C6|nr:hypothetical protein [Nocardia aurea]